MPRPGSVGAVAVVGGDARSRLPVVVITGKDEPGVGEEVLASSYQQQRSASASSSWSQNRQSMESQAQARSWGNQQHQSAPSWQN